VIRIAKKTDPKRLEELKKKIHNEEYLAFAIDMIAQNLTKSLLNED
jgi:hypothetical protein